MASFGGAAPFDKVNIDVDFEKGDRKFSYWCGGKRVAVAVIHRDLVDLGTEIAFERVDASSPGKLRDAGQDSHINDYLIATAWVENLCMRPCAYESMQFAIKPS